MPYDCAPLVVIVTVECTVTSPPRPAVPPFAAGSAPYASPPWPPLPPWLDTEMPGVLSACDETSPLLASVNVSSSVSPGEPGSPLCADSPMVQQLKMQISTPQPSRPLLPL